MDPTVIDKSQPIKSIGSRLRYHTRTFYYGVRARCTYALSGVRGTGPNVCYTARARRDCFIWAE